MQIAEIFDEVAQQMRSDLAKARGAVQHPGLKGAFFEETFRGFLREYLPKSLDISTGVLVDAHGNSSRQVDVIVSDAAKTPILYRSGDVRVIPVECVYAIIEVKAYLDNNEIDGILKNMKSVRALEKKSYYKPAGPVRTSSKLYGKEWEMWPTTYFVFAFDSTELNTLASYIEQKHKEERLPEWSRIDTVCVLDKGVILNLLAGGTFSALPEPGSRLYVSKTNRALLLFYALTSVFLFQARLPNFNFVDYLQQLHF
jgi:hypothetical protein